MLIIAVFNHSTSKDFSDEVVVEILQVSRNLNVSLLTKSFTHF